MYHCLIFLSSTILFSLAKIQEQVINIILKISCNKASSIDKINASLLRIAATNIAPSIERIINCSFSSGKFPQRCKIAKVTPLLKSGANGNACNYRPISVLPILSKIIERHMHDALYIFLNSNNLISFPRSGFRKGHSTETALIKIIDNLLFNLDEEKVSGMIHVDYQKAFDMVDHNILLEKLVAYGFENRELQWCLSYLSQRKQVIQIGNKVLRDGVPQGSILGPLLFLIFINDLPLHVPSETDLFADDTTIIESADYRNVSELSSSLNKSINEIELWAKANKLPSNEENTKLLMITGKRLASKLKSL